jgi:hypothetical protein
MMLEAFKALLLRSVNWTASHLRGLLYLDAGRSNFPSVIIMVLDLFANFPEKVPLIRLALSEMMLTVTNWATKSLSNTPGSEYLAVYLPPFPFIVVVAFGEIQSAICGGRLPLYFRSMLTRPILMISEAVLKAVFSIVDVPISLKDCPSMRQENEKLACPEAPVTSHVRKKARRSFLEQIDFGNIRLVFCYNKAGFQS